MNDVLKQELIGRAPVFVSLGGQDYPLAFPIHAVILYKRSTGDNLFDGVCWKKIAPLEDPERFLACLWAGLHVQEPDETWTCPFSVAQLERLVDFTNVTPACEAIALALASYFPAAKEPPKDDASPKPPEPEEVMAPAVSEEVSVNSGLSLVSTLS
jgi:hypothetical protein